MLAPALTPTTTDLPRLRAEAARKALRRDRWIAFAATAALHFTILAGIAYQNVKAIAIPLPDEVAKPADVFIMDLAPEELPPPPEAEEDILDDAPQEDLGGPLTASLPEPPSAVSLSGAITDRIRPTPPVMPRPDGLSGMTVPIRRAVAQAGVGARPSGLTNVFDATQLDQQPTARSQPAIVYPPNLRRQGIGGLVVVRFIVTEAGGVAEPEVVRASHPEFAEAVLRALQNTRWTPGRKDGRIVNSRMEWPFPFQVSDAE
jgi:protein TonB